MVMEVFGAVVEDVGWFIYHGIDYPSYNSPTCE